MTLKATGQITLTDLNDAIITGTAPLNPTTATLWLDTSTTPNALKRWTGSAWAKASVTTADDINSYTKPQVDSSIEDTKKYVQSRTENLVTNGTGLLGNNTNFSGFTFDGSQVYAGGGSFYTNKQNATLFNDEMIPVDTSKKYRFSLMAKSEKGIGNEYYGVTSYDIDGNSISPYHFYGSQFPITTLAKDLKIGDTEIHLTSSVGFMDNSTTADHFHSIVFWGYKNSFGYEYPAGTYSRDIFTIGWNKGAINRTTHVITLNKPFNYKNPNDSQGIYKVGHKVSPTQSGSGYQYMTASNVKTPAEWTKYEGTITGNGVSSNKFPYGTAFVKLLFLTNRNTSGGQAGDSLWLNSLEFTDVTQEENAKNHANSVVSVVETRLTTAEQKITDSAILSTVTSSTKWTTLNTDVGIAKTDSSKALTDSSTALSTANNVNTSLGELDAIVVGKVDSIDFETVQKSTDEQVTSLTETVGGKADNTVVDGLNAEILATQESVSTQATRITTVEQTASSVKTSVTALQSSVNANSEVISSVETYMDFSDEGLEIGKSDSDMKVNITNAEIQFKDNGAKVAYINGQKMYITESEVLSSLIIGNHKFEKTGTSTTIKWVGGN